MSRHVGRVVSELRRPCAGYRGVATALSGLSRSRNGPASMSQKCEANCKEISEGLADLHNELGGSKWLSAALR